jgi:hypothetical protein
MYVGFYSFFEEMGYALEGCPGGRVVLVAHLWRGRFPSAGRLS